MLDELITDLVIDQINENNNEYTILGTVRGKKALLFLKSNSLSPQDVVSILKNHTTKQEIVRNDIFSTYNLNAEGIYFLRVIYPADDSKIKKYTQKLRVYIKETKEMYDAKLKIEIESLRHKTNWIRNLINDQESGTIKEKVFYGDDNIMIITNYKWDMKNVSNMYLLVLFKDESLYTVRELRDASFLRSVRKIVGEVVKKEFGLDDDQIYCFFHYPPTYFVLHLHVVNVNFYGNFCLVGKAVLLDEVIENLENDELYYSKKTMLCFERQ